MYKEDILTDEKSYDQYYKGHGHVNKRTQSVKNITINNQLFNKVKSQNMNK